MLPTETVLPVRPVLLEELRQARVMGELEDFTFYLTNRFTLKPWIEQFEKKAKVRKPRTKKVVETVSRGIHTTGGCGGAMTLEPGTGKNLADWLCTKCGRRWPTRGKK